MPNREIFKQIEREWQELGIQEKRNVFGIYPDRYDYYIRRSRELLWEKIERHLIIAYCNGNKNPIIQVGDCMPVQYLMDEHMGIGLEQWCRNLLKGARYGQGV